MRVESKDDLIMKNMGKIIFFIAIIQLIVVVGVFLYLGGFKKHGMPSEFKSQELVKIQARLDSIEALERSSLLPENIADSTLFGVGKHTDIFEEMEESDTHLKTILTSLDSLEQGKKVLEEKEMQIDNKIKNLQELNTLAENENIKRLASIYDGMKAPQAVPLFITMNDTIAVSIISQMNERNASKLLGALADTDLGKATRLNRMLAEMGNY